MFQILVVSHEPFAGATLALARQILGNDISVFALDIGANEAPDKAQERCRAFIEELKVDGDVLVLVDFLGGTPSNLVLPYMSDGEVEIVTGFNLPMLFKAVSMAQSGAILGELVTDLVDYGAKHIQRAADLLAE